MFLKTNSFERKIKSIIPKEVKKILLKFIVNSFSGFIIKHLNIKFNLFNGVFDYKLVNNYQAKKNEGTSRNGCVTCDTICRPIFGYKKNDPEPVELEENGEYPDSAGLKTTQKVEMQSITIENGAATTNRHR